MREQGGEEVQRGGDDVIRLREREGERRNKVERNGSTGREEGDEKERRKVERGGGKGRRRGRERR